MENKSLGFIGGGRITRIFLQAFKNRHVKFSSVKIHEPDNRVFELLKAQFDDIEKVVSPSETVNQDILILAVHPPVMMDTLSSIKNHIPKKAIVLSLAPKISIQKMAQVLPDCKIARMIPNATSFINEGYNPVTFQNSFSELEKQELLDLFSILGETFETEENKLEGYAIVSAMLPTYFWFQWKKMEDIALKTGLSNKEAAITIQKSLNKAINLLYNSDLSAEEVIDLVPVKPVGEHENEIISVYEKKLMGLFEKIRPTDS